MGPLFGEETIRLLSLKTKDFEIFKDLVGFFPVGAPHVLLANGPGMTSPCRRWSPIRRAPNQGVPTPKLPCQDTRVAAGPTKGAMHLQ